MSSSHLCIPVSICIYSFEKKCIGSLQLFCWFKLNCNHRFCITNQILYKAITDLGITKTTFNSRINWLLHHKWISCNAKYISYHANSFNIIHCKTNLRIKKGIIWDSPDFRKFKAFVDATILGYYAKRKNYIEIEKIRLKYGTNRVRMNKARPMKNSASRSFNLPLNYLYKATNIPKSTIQKMKISAVKHSFIEIKNSFALTTISVEQLHCLRSIGGFHHENIKKMVIKKGKVFEQQPDQFFLNIDFKNKRNLKQL